MNETNIVAIVVAGMSLIGSILGNYWAQRKSSALIAYRLEQLEKKVAKHNNLVERTYKLEQKQCITEEQVKVANHRIADLEKGVC